MKVLAFNCSPKMDKGNTALLFIPFLEGIREAGAEVELLYTKKLDINPCQGCYTCWYKTPGKCFQKDDMQMLLPKLREADIWVFATPVYWSGASGPMKNLIDRTCPLSEPFIELRDGRSRVIMRKGAKHSKVVLVSSCGLWEKSNFDEMIVHVKDFCAGLALKYEGALLRPHAELLKPMMERGEPLDDIFKAAKCAGRQLVREGKISAETFNIISRELMPLETFIQDNNQSSQQTLDRLRNK